MATENISPCGHCNTSIADMVSPRRLPCNHVFCQKCLTSQLGTQDQITCCTCQQVLEPGVLPDSLPLDYGVKYSCTACLKRGVSTKATHYCRDCDKRMCDKHTESHEEVTDHEQVVSIQEADTPSQMTSTDKCPNHPSETVISGCTKCFQLVCMQCLHTDLEHFTCKNGERHALKPVEEVVVLVKDELQNIANVLEQKRAAFNNVKVSTKGMRSSVETRYALQLTDLHRQRDEKIQKLREKYQNLEDELTESYRQVDKKLETYQEDTLTESVDPLLQKITVIENLSASFNIMDVNCDQLKQEAFQLSMRSVPSVGMISSEDKFSLVDSDEFPDLQVFDDAYDEDAEEGEENGDFNEDLDGQFDEELEDEELEDGDFEGDDLDGEGEDEEEDEVDYYVEDDDASGSFLSGEDKELEEPLVEDARSNVSDDWGKDSWMIRDGFKESETASTASHESQGSGVRPQPERRRYNASQRGSGRCSSRITKDNIDQDMAAYLLGIDTYKHSSRSRGGRGGRSRGGRGIRRGSHHPIRGSSPTPNGRSQGHYRGNTEGSSGDSRGRRGYRRPYQSTSERRFDQGQGGVYHDDSSCTSDRGSWSMNSPHDSQTTGRGGSYRGSRGGSRGGSRSRGRGRGHRGRGGTSSWSSDSQSKEGI